jgi:hypothetical protein
MCLICAFLFYLVQFVVEYIEYKNVYSMNNMKSF